MAESASAAPAPHPWKRYVLIAVPIVVVLAVLGFLFKDRIQIQGYINRLSNSDARVRKEQMDALRAHEDTELVNELLLEAVKDDERTFEARMISANLLLERQRLAMLEQVFEKGALEARGVVLRAFSRKPWFDKFVEDQAGRVQETIRTWIEKGSLLTRSHAIQLAVQLDMQDVEPALRSVLAGPHPDNVHPEVLRDLLISAAGAAERLEDCESIPRIAEMARTHQHPLVRLRFMQVVARAVFRANPEPLCPGAVPEERMVDIVQAALADDDHRVRMGGMLLLARHSAWAEGQNERLLAILDGQGTPAERRQALETLVVTGGAAFHERFPRYFHDPSVEVRASAARMATSIDTPPMIGALTGVVRDEVESEMIWMEAVDNLRRAAKSWHGLDAEQEARALRDPEAWRKELETLFRRGELGTMTRDDFADAWFRWWCGELQLGEERTEKALAARAAFYEAKRKADAAAAQAALDGAGFDVPGLFAYERGWLQRK